MNALRTARWTTRSVGVGERTEGWSEALASSLVAFEVHVEQPHAFQAATTRHAFADLVLTDCVVSPSRGKRGSREIGADPGWAGVLVVEAGHERIRHGTSDLLLGPGDVLVWDGDVPITFDVVEPLRKRMLMLSRDRVLGLGGPLPVHLPAGAPKGRLLDSYLAVLARELPGLDELSRGAAANGVLELLRAVLAPPTGGLRVTVLPQARAYIDARLPSASLSPQQVAAAHSVSVRTLHAIFEPTGESFGEYVKRRRLEQARTDLLADASVSISRVAFRWGFRNSAHFSRSFREAFGTSPRNVRDRPLEPAMAPSSTAAPRGGTDRRQTPIGVPAVTSRCTS